MLKYDTNALLQNKNTYYELVISVAKRARAIVEQAELEHEILDDKPVRMAIDELQSGKYMIRHEEPGHAEESAPAAAPASFAGHLSSEALLERDGVAQEDGEEIGAEDEDSFDAGPDNKPEDEIPDETGDEEEPEE